MQLARIARARRCGSPVRRDVRRICMGGAGAIQAQFSCHAGHAPAALGSSLHGGIDGDLLVPASRSFSRPVGFGESGKGSATHAIDFIDVERRSSSHSRLTSVGIWWSENPCTLAGVNAPCRATVAVAGCGAINREAAELELRKAECRRYRLEDPGRRGASQHLRVCDVARGKRAPGLRVVGGRASCRTWHEEPNRASRRNACDLRAICPPRPTPGHDGRSHSLHRNLVHGQAIQPDGRATGRGHRNRGGRLDIFTLGQKDDARKPDPQANAEALNQINARISADPVRKELWQEFQLPWQFFQRH